MNCAVIGAGAWGTALANVLAANGHSVVLWAREPDVVEAVNASRENRRFLPGVCIGDGVRATGTIDDALGDAEIVTYVAPSHALRDVAASGAASTRPDAVLVVASIGTEHAREQDLRSRAERMGLHGPRLAERPHADRHTFATVGVGSHVLSESHAV